MTLPTHLEEDAFVEEEMRKALETILEAMRNLTWEQRCKLVKTVGVFHNIPEYK